MSSTRVITLEELRQNNGKNGSKYWMAIHDKVYDIGKFMDKHPGGEAVMVELSGGYATHGFDDVSHSEDAKELLPEMQVGVMAEDDKEILEAEEVTTQSSGLLAKLLPVVLPLAVAVLYAIYNHCL